MIQDGDPADRQQTSGPDAYVPPSYAEAPPRLVGGKPSVDFVNTRTQKGEDVPPVERLTDYRELLYWSGAVGLLEPQDVRDLGYGTLANPALAAEALRTALTLRAALVELFESPVGGAPEALALVNRMLDAAPQRKRLVRDPDGYAWRIERLEDDLERPVWAILWDAAELLSSDRLPQIRRCAAADCNWMFLDETRNRSRRWCSMEDCGNRAKARRHYAKKKGRQAAAS